MATDPMNAGGAATVDTPAPETVPVGLWAFFAYFRRLGTTGFGGPIALAGFMQRDLVDERRWISRQDYLDGVPARVPVRRRAGAVLPRHRSQPLVTGFVEGVSAAATGATGGAALVLATRAITDAWTAAIAVLTFVVLLGFKVSELWLIGAAAIIGLVLNGAP